MNIIIVGGSGFVSGTLARVAVAAGHRVWAVTRGKRPMGEGVTPILADRTDRDGFARAVEALDQRFDLAVDCIGYDADDVRQDVRVFRDRADHFVFVSTDFVYDPARRTVPQRVDHPHFETQRPYGTGKRQGELVLLESDTKPMAWTILRPCHIYGPGSLLGCLPRHGRDAQLIESLCAGRPLALVGGGHFLQQPILAADLARMVLSCAGKKDADGQVFHAAGPDTIESRHYYRIIADALGTDLAIEEVPVDDHLETHPNHAPFLCDRVYDLYDLESLDVHVPATTIETGLRQHVASLMGSG